jgi:hypothetical protein
MIIGKLKFAFHIALYPSCYGFESVQMTGAPILTLMGEKDDWTPAATCVNLTNTLKIVGYATNIILMSSKSRIGMCRRSSIEDE